MMTMLPARLGHLHDRMKAVGYDASNNCSTYGMLPAACPLQMYVFCLFMRVLLSWFPGIDWNAQPWTFLRLVRAAQQQLAATPQHY
jgi:hypothetical protein